MEEEEEEDMDEDMAEAHAVEFDLVRILYD